MKIADYRRHGPKDGNNISGSGLAAAQKVGTDTPQESQYKYAAAGNESRTWQTLAAFLLGYLLGRMENWPRLLTPIAKFGDGKLFGSWFDRGLGEAVKATGSNILGVHKILPENEFRQECANALDGVRDMFSQMENGGHCIAFGHSPIIEMAAIAAGMSIDDVPKLAELEGIRFVLQDDGSITTVTGLIA